MFNRVLSASRYMIIIAVIGSFVAALLLMIYGGLEVIQLLVEVISKAEISSKGAKSLAVSFIVVVDLFLLGTVFYIIALGLYELFIDDSVPTPDWLTIHTLDDLKAKLTSVVVVVLGVLFLGQVVAWDGQRDLMSFGVPVALVIAALTYFLSQKGKKDEK